MGWKMGERVEREWSEEDERPLGKISDYLVWEWRPLYDTPPTVYMCNGIGTSAL